MGQLVPLGAIEDTEIKHEIKYSPCYCHITYSPYNGVFVFGKDFKYLFHACFIIDNIVVLSNVLEVKKFFFLLMFYGIITRII